MDKANNTIDAWLGLNESADGDTRLKAGEAVDMENFAITADGGLQIRPGTKTVCTLSPGDKIQGIWSGYVGESKVLLAACGGHVWQVDVEGESALSLGELADAPTTFFGFDNCAYILNGQGYYRWDGGDAIQEVEGYIPLVAVGAPPTGGGTLLERANLLTTARRMRFSPNGNSNVFYLPNPPIADVRGVYYMGQAVSEYSVNPTTGVVTTTATIYPVGVDTLEVVWDALASDRDRVEGMKFAEEYNGVTDSRVFLYGDGSNRAIYSEPTVDGGPSAAYFPDLNYLDVGAENTPLTGLIRHYSTLLAFKSDGAYTVNYGTITTADEVLTAAFYITPVNRDIGHVPMGQVALVYNDPWTIFQDKIYRWETGGSTLTRDERQAQRQSDRVAQTLRQWDTAHCTVFDDEDTLQFYIMDGLGQALVYHYGQDAWYRYGQFPARLMCRHGQCVLLATDDGRLCHLSRDYRNDDGVAIQAHWESGSMEFDKPWQRKRLCALWVSLRPESGARLTVTHQTNLRSAYPKVAAAAGLATFDHCDFNHWSFATNRKPQTTRVPLAAKKFTAYKLLFTSNSATSTATVLGANLCVEPMGVVK